MKRIGILYLLSASLILVIINSCVSHKKLVLLKEQKKEKDSIIVKEIKQAYVIQSGDLLRIKVSSLDPASVGIFNKVLGHGNVPNYSEAAIYLTSYQVDDSGNVSFPIIGDVPMKGQTIKNATRILEDSLRNYYKVISVDIKLMSFRISILGEVNKPGIYTFYNENVNLLQAISKAGGISNLGNRKKVKIVRSDGEKFKVITTNVNSVDVLNSEYFYLQPDDAIYVQPLKVKSLIANSSTLSLIISGLTIALSVVTLVK